MNALIIFIAQFCVVYLMGIQSLNIKGGHYLAAAITSFIMGVFAFASTSIIGKIALSDIISVVGIVFLVAGPLGITCAMASHKHLISYFKGLRRSI